MLVYRIEESTAVGRRKLCYTPGHRIRQSGFSRTESYYNHSKSST